MKSRSISNETAGGLKKKRERKEVKGQEIDAFLYIFIEALDKLDKIDEAIRIGCLNDRHSTAQVFEMGQ
jgi:hypothetical protein